MQVKTDPIKNKQRIYIGGNHGADEIFEIVRMVLNHLKKPVDFYTVGEDYEPSEAPVVILRGADQKENGGALFHQLDIHILLIHKIEDDIPEGYDSLDDYLAEYEALADSLPKAGSFIYFEGDDVAVLLGKKEREDVKAIEYSALEADKSADGFTLKTAAGKINIKTSNDRFPNHAAGARTLVNRIGVTDQQFFNALKSLS